MQPCHVEVEVLLFAEPYQEYAPGREASFRVEQDGAVPFALEVAAAHDPEQGSAESLVDGPGGTPEAGGGACALE